MVGKYVYPPIRLKRYFWGCVPAHTAYHSAAVYHAKEHRAAERFSSFREVYFTFSDWEATLYESPTTSIFLLEFLNIQKSWKNCIQWASIYVPSKSYNYQFIIFACESLFFLYHWSAWDNSHVIYNFGGGELLILLGQHSFLKYEI